MNLYKIIMRYNYLLSNNKKVKMSNYYNFFKKKNLYIYNHLTCFHLIIINDMRI